MNFENPYYFFALLLLPILWLLYFGSEKRRVRKLNRFSRKNESATSTRSRSRTRVKELCLSLSMLFLIVAFTRPQWGFITQEVQRKGLDFVIVFDTSKSMLAEDIKPNRFIRSKLAVLELVDKLKDDQIGLIAFAGSAFLQCPLTLDYDAFRQSLEALDTNIIPQGGTDIAQAISEAQATFEKDDNFKILILITDGEDLEASGIVQAKEAKDKGIRIFAVGVGSDDGELIPVTNEYGEKSYLKDQSGNYVKTKLDASTLRTIAEASGGFYVPLGSTGNGLNTVYEKGISQLPKQDQELKVLEIPIERYQWFLMASMFFLLVDLFIGNRRRNAN